MYSLQFLLEERCTKITLGVTIFAIRIAKFDTNNDKHKQYIAKTNIFCCQLTATIIKRTLHLSTIESVLQLYTKQIVNSHKWYLI